MTGARPVRQSQRGESILALRWAQQLGAPSHIQHGCMEHYAEMVQAAQTGAILTC